jgi:cell division protease FtsH
MKRLLRAVDESVLPGTVPTMPDTKTEPTTPLRARRGRTVLLVVLLLGVLLTMRPDTPKGPERGDEVPYSTILTRLEDEKVTKAWLEDGTSTIVIETTDGKYVHASYPRGAGSDILTELGERQVTIEVVPAQNPSLLPSLILTLLPVVLILGFFVMLSKRGGLGGVGALGLGKSKAAPVDIPDTRFSDVAGIDEALADLEEVVALLHDPDRYRKIGANRPRGFLLVGPPGTGKTLLARAVAGEAGVPFYAIAGADFVELFAGMGASRVRDLFNKARSQEKAIIFIDEIDAVGKARGRGMFTGANDERENTLNALLVELDGFSRHDGIVILAATNRVDVLDPALLRPGRFDRTIVVPAPDRTGRRKIMELYSKNRPFDALVDWEQIARRTQGMTGAQLEQLLNEAALEAVRASATVIDASHMETALATTMLGRERKSAVVSDRDRRIVAWHEAGHALAALLLEHADDPVQVSIIPRGGTGGATWMAGSEHDLVTRSQALASLVVALSGRAAEEVLLDGDHTQGAHGDLQMSTQLATEMIARYGMGKRLVSRSADRLAMDGPVSQEVDDEVDDLLRDSLEQSRQLMRRNTELLRAVAEALLELENLSLADLRLLASQHTAR